METGKSKEIISMNFRRLLKESGKRMVDFSRDNGVSLSTVSDWYNGVATPRAKAMDMIAAYFHVPISELTRDHALGWDEPITDIPFTATDDEEVLIRKIRALDDKDTEIIERYVDAMYDRLTGEDDERD